MGIQGLIPFLKKASSPVNIRNFSGCTVAVDAYCWLHKGAFSCADKLAKGELTDGYIHYCIKMVNILLNAGLQPVMVFDGQRLPSKALTESKRHMNRQKYKNKAKECLIKGDIRGAKECFQRCTEVTSKMALEVIQACRKLGVDCIVAPYEADAQLAYLCQIGVSQVVITEDSDLVLFGCERIIFKMDAAGNGILVERSKLHLCLGLKAENFTFDKFRYMCIMSGCDYLPSLHGIGLGKAQKFFSKTTNPDLQQVLRKIPVYLNMSNVAVTKEYIASFLQADQTFLYQLVYDPLKRKLVPLNPYPYDMNPEELDYAGPRITDQLAYQIALGNVSVDSLTKVDNFDPDKDSAVLKNFKRKSIWNPTYTVLAQQPVKNVDKKSDNIRNISSKVSPTSTLSNRNQLPRMSPRLKRSHSEEDSLTDENIFGMYGVESTETVKRCKLEPVPDLKQVGMKATAILPLPKIVQSRYFASPPEETKNTDEAKISVNNMSAGNNVMTKNMDEAEISVNNMSTTNHVMTSLTSSPISDKLTECISQEPSSSEQLVKTTPFKEHRLNQFQNNGKVNTRDATSARQCGSRLFFDTAIASRNPFYAVKTPVHQERSSRSVGSRKGGNFGNWSSLHNYFSCSVLDSVSKSPKNHTEFKQVVRQSMTGVNHFEDDKAGQHVMDCHVTPPQNSQISTSASRSPASQNVSLGIQTPETNSSIRQSIFELNDALDTDKTQQIQKENFKEAATVKHELTSIKVGVTSALKPAPDTNSHVIHLEKVCHMQAQKHIGLKKKNLTDDRQNGLLKQRSIKELFSKFHYIRSK